MTQTCLVVSWGTPNPKDFLTKQLDGSSSDFGTIDRTFGDGKSEEKQEELDSRQAGARHAEECHHVTLSSFPSAIHPYSLSRTVAIGNLRGLERIREDEVRAGGNQGCQTLFFELHSSRRRYILITRLLGRKSSGGAAHRGKFGRETGRRKKDRPRASIRGKMFTGFCINLTRGVFPGAARPLIQQEGESCAHH